MRFILHVFLGTARDELHSVFPFNEITHRWAVGVWFRGLPFCVLGLARTYDSVDRARFDDFAPFTIAALARRWLCCFAWFE